MKNWTWFTVTSSLAIWIAAPAIFAETVLYSHPDESEEAVATIPAGDPRLQVRGPVVDAAAAEAGWQWGELEDSFEGFVTVAKIGKDLYPVPGTMVHLQADIDSPVLTTITDEDLDSGQVEILDEGEWWQVRVHKSIPVFFLLTPEAVEIDAIDPYVYQDDSEYEETEEALALVEEEVTGAETVAVREVERTEPAEITRIPERAEPMSHGSTVRGTLGSTFRGTLHPTGRRFLVGTHPFPYELRDRSNRRIAYVDMSDAVLRYPINRYLNDPVSIFGTWEPIEDSRAIVIRARNITILSPNY